MKDKEYKDYVSHQQAFVDEYKTHNICPRELENYPIYITYGEDNHWYFRFQSNLKYFQADDEMTLKDIETELIKDIPYIKSIQFYDEFGYSAGIII